MSRTRNALLATAIGLSLAAGVTAQEPGPPHETNIVVGEAPPTTFVLESIDGEIHDLGAAAGERPILLLFFRGTW